SNDVAREAVRRLRDAGAVIRSQAPLLRHVNDDAEAWARMWREQVQMGIVPYYMFVERDTGAREYFEVPLVEAWQIHRDAIQRCSGLSRTARGPSMSCEPGKVEISGVTEVAGEKVFVLRFIQGRNPDWIDRPFFAAFDEKATWMNHLRPAFDEPEFFFEPELFRIIAGYVTSPLLRLSQLWQNFQETALSLERLSDIVDHPQEAEADARGNLPMPLIQGAITYDQVSFRFGNSGPLQLDNVSLEIPAGAFVGIVGLSGSGKSTLTKLLPRLYHPLGGRILVDGYDIHKVELYSLRRQIGIVPQNTLLFEGTVQENIALTNPDATFEEIVAAAKVAAAHDFIMELPAGYNSLVGERGANLSGGQRQRVAIARTILQDPRLLIMDEATSALDYDTESQVCRNLVQAFKGRTVLFITHRLRTIQHADRIVMMGNGAILEQGPHEELMQLQGSYFCLFRQQDD
ncbi:MAG: ATP-binding cassette domain-containing protein, partial [Spirulina sp. SIO3F2]|nr:ATP-binding cassette domain-containing protein [Spirulina sp. SIO3F2]